MDPSGLCTEEVNGDYYSNGDSECPATPVGASQPDPAPLDIGYMIYATAYDFYDSSIDPGFGFLGLSFFGNAFSPLGGFLGISPAHGAAGSSGNTCPAEPLHIPLRVTSPYGVRTLNGQRQLHPGVDYGAPIGTPVYAAYSGTVTIAHFSRSAGNVIDITTPSFGSSIYMHLSSIGVTVGQSVGAGQQIGLSGNTGNSTGPHLHFEQHSPGPPYANGVFNLATSVPPCR
jgi:murein DD-endopeptidase MepM/ murein hydrolase activator NlpD